MIFIWRRRQRRSRTSIYWEDTTRFPWITLQKHVQSIWRLFSGDRHLHFGAKQKQKEGKKDKILTVIKKDGCKATYNPGLQHFLSMYRKPHHGSVFSFVFFYTLVFSETRVIDNIMTWPTETSLIILYISLSLLRVWNSWCMFGNFLAKMIRYILH